MSLQVDIVKKLPAFTLRVKLDVDNGALALLGASGCGKSFTLRCIAGFETPDEGRIVVNDTVFFDSKARVNLSPQRRKTAILFQNYQLFPNLTVAQNVAAGMPDSLTRAQRDERVHEYLEMMGLVGFERRYPMSLSGGQQQRVALARMLAAKSDILLLDEPFSALDAHMKRELERNMRDIFDTFTGPIVYVSHDIDEAYRLSNRIAVMSEGHVVECGSRDDILARPTSLAGLKLSGHRNISRARLADGTLHATDWGIALEADGCEIPEDVAYVGAREDLLIPLDGESGSQSLHRAGAPGDSLPTFDFRIERVVEGRFDYVLDLVANAPERDFAAIEPISVAIAKEPGAVGVPYQPGDTLRVAVDLTRLLFVRG